MYEAPEPGEIERAREQHRLEQVRQTRQLALTEHDHREGVECPKCRLLDQARLAGRPNMPPCPNCATNDEVSREGDRFFCERCDLAFMPATLL